MLVFFTLSSLVELYEGIQKISENKGRVKIVTSPKITREDFEFIKDAYEQKESQNKRNNYERVS